MAACGISLAAYWFIWGLVTRAIDIKFLIILKFIFYCNLFVFFNSAFCLHAIASGKELEDKQYVLFNLFIYALLLLIELPNLIATAWPPLS